MKIISYVLEDGKPPMLLDDYLIAHSKRKLGKEKIAQIIRLINTLMTYFGIRLKLEKTNVKNRTALQNSSIHLLYQKTADKLNDGGLGMRVSIPPEASWSMERVKDLIWRTFQIATTGKKSTTLLTTKEVNEVYEEYNRYLSDMGVHVKFQCVENMLFERVTKGG